MVTKIKDGSSVIVFNEHSVELLLVLDNTNKSFGNYEYSKQLKEKLIKIGIKLPFSMWLKLINKCK